MHPNWGSNPQPRYVPWPGIEPATFWCKEQCSNQLSYVARALRSLLTPLLHKPTKGKGLLTSCHHWTRQKKRASALSQTANVSASLLQLLVLQLSSHGRHHLALHLAWLEDQASVLLVSWPCIDSSLTFSLRQWSETSRTRFLKLNSISKKFCTLWQFWKPSKILFKQQQTYLVSVRWAGWLGTSSLFTAFLCSPSFQGCNPSQLQFLAPALV